MDDDTRPGVDDPNFVGYNYRRPVHLLKVAMAFAASEGPDMILTEHIFDRSLLALEEIEPLMPHALRGLGKSSLAEVTTDVMRLIEHTGIISHSRLMRRFYHDVDKDELKRVMSTLIDMEFCSTIVKGADSTPPKPKIFYQLNKRIE